MSFARNFALGQQIASTAMDTYDQARQRREFSDIQEAKPQTVQEFTPQDGAQMEAMQSVVNPATGKPYYDVQDNGRGGLQLRNNFEYAGRDGTQVAAGGVTQPWNKTRFLGGTYDGELSQDRMDTLRTRAMAGVISKTDPIRGMGLLQQARASERDDERYGWEREAQPLKQRAAALALSSAERVEQQGVRDDDWRTGLGSSLAKLKDTPIADKRKIIEEKLNYGSRGNGFMSIGEPVVGKDGKTTPGAAYFMPENGGPPIILSMADVDRMIAVSENQHIDPIRAMNEMQALSNNGQEAARQIFKINLDAQGVANQSRQVDNQSRQIDNLARYQDGTLEARQYGVDARMAATDARMQSTGQVDPRYYTQALASATSALGDPTQAKMLVDRLYGMGPQTDAIVDSLREQNNSKGAQAADDADRARFDRNYRRLGDNSGLRAARAQPAEQYQQNNGGRDTVPALPPIPKGQGGALPPLPPITGSAPGGIRPRPQPPLIAPSDIARVGELLRGANVDKHKGITPPSKPARVNFNIAPSR